MFSRKPFSYVLDLCDVTQLCEFLKVLTDRRNVLLKSRGAKRGGCVEGHSGGRRSGLESFPDPVQVVLDLNFTEWRRFPEHNHVSWNVFCLKRTKVTDDVGLFGVQARTDWFQWSLWFVYHFLLPSQHLHPNVLISAKTQESISFP